MARSKRLLVGLGNPGDTYEDTRHNVGFAVVDRLAEQWAVTLRKDVRTVALAGEHRWRGCPIVLAKPLSWMNRSGQAVRKLQHRYGLESRECMIIMDDINLPIGRLRLRPGGGAGGHNGLQDIIDSLGTDAFPRMRIGVGNKFSRGQQARYVLSPFTPEELEQVTVVLGLACDASKMFVSEGLTTAMNRFNRYNSAVDTS